jgi:hypothetical protein
MITVIHFYIFFKKTKENLDMGFCVHFYTWSHAPTATKLSISGSFSQRIVLLFGIPWIVYYGMFDFRCFGFIG